jgi:RNA polymerase sigma factor (sigma-70 family)
LLPTHDEALALFSDNYGLVKWYAAKYRTIENFDDLCQSAAIGLWKAVQTWDPSRAKLSVHAKVLMRAEIQLYLRKAGVTRGRKNGTVQPVPFSLHELTDRPGGGYMVSTNGRGFSPALAHVVRNTKGHRLPDLEQQETTVYE